MDFFILLDLQNLNNYLMLLAAGRSYQGGSDEDVQRLHADARSVYGV